MVIPKLYIHTTWWLSNNVLIRVCRCSSVLLVHCLEVSLPLNQEGCKSSALFGTLEIIAKELINILLVDVNGPFLVLEILFWSSLLLDFFDQVVELLRVQSCNNCIEKLSLRQTLLLPMRIR